MGREGLSKDGGVEEDIEEVKRDRNNTVQKFQTHKRLK